MGYQDFDGKGSSKSHEKLKALDLAGLARRLGISRETPLAGLSVLDIGCNEGFFCIEAMKMGAKRAVGVDANAEFIAAAKARNPQLEFIKARWWDLPNEKFDVIFFLSAMHYEPNPKAFFEKLKNHLTPTGTLILECGVAPDSPVNGRAWQTFDRWDGAKRYPTTDLLINDILVGYAVRPVGRSVLQAGDQVPRTVFHCQAKSPTALIVSGTSGQGKTSLSTSMETRGIPTYGTDALLLLLLRDKRYAWRPISKKLNDKYPTNEGLNLAAVAIYMVEEGMQSEFCDIIVTECPSEAELFCIQGDALRHDGIRSTLIDRLSKKGIRSWHVSPN